MFKSWFSCCDVVEDKNVNLSISKEPNVIDPNSSNPSDQITDRQMLKSKNQYIYAGDKMQDYYSVKPASLERTITPTFRDNTPEPTESKNYNSSNFRQTFGANSNQIIEENEIVETVSKGHINNDNGSDQFPIAKHQRSHPNEKEEFSIDYSDNKREYIDDYIKNAPILLLKDEEGNILSNKELQINAAGMIDGSRKIKDGVTFFGTELEVGDIIINDCLLNFDQSIIKGIGPYVFIIYYKKETNTYFIRSCRDKTNTGYFLILIKLDSDYVKSIIYIKYLKSKEIVAIGDIFFKMTTNESGDIEISKLGKNDNFKKFVFTKEEEIITIGRSKNCQVCFEEETTFSKVHSTLIWNNNKNSWRIIDGKDHTKRSTNGTWLYAAHSVEIKNGTICKIGTSKIKLNYAL